MKKQDSVILVTNPPLLIIFLSVAKLIKKFTYSIIVHDVFPENLLIIGVMKANSFFYNGLLNLFNWAFKKADLLIVCGQDMKDVFLRKLSASVPIQVIPNWADHSEIINLPNFDREIYYNKELKEKIVLQFAGNIGRVQGLEFFLDILLEVNNEKILIVIIGDGALKTRLENLVQSNNIKNIIFLSTKPRAEQINFLNACDIGLVTLSPGMFGLGVPSKVYNIFSASKPVLFIGDLNSEVYNYVEQFGVGWAFSWGERTKIIGFLNNLSMSDLPIIHSKGKAARHLIEEKFTKEIILKKYETLFSDI